MRQGASSYARSSAGAVGSFAVHVVLAALLSYLSVEPAGPTEPQIDIVEFVIPEPEPEPDKPPEPVPEVRKDEPPPKPKVKVKPAPTSSQPVADEPPPPLRFDASQTTQTGNSGVTVQTGTPGGTPGGTGKPDSQGKGSRPVGSDTGDAGAPAWEPRSELYIRELPAVLNVPQEQCPAVQELGIEGVVILTVQVRRDGSVKDVRVARDIGHGCGKIAARALRKAKFRPAIATNGQPADFELRYEYEFQLGD